MGVDYYMTLGVDRKIKKNVLFSQTCHENGINTKEAEAKFKEISEAIMCSVILRKELCMISMISMGIQLLNWFGFGSSFGGGTGRASGSMTQGPRKDPSVVRKLHCPLEDFFFLPGCHQEF